MDELNAAPSSTEPSSEAAKTDMQGAGTAAVGEPAAPSAIAASPAAAADTQDASQQPSTTQEIDFSSVATAPQESQAPVEPSTNTVPAADQLPTNDAPTVGGGFDAPPRLLMLDVMLAEIERKIAAGIHTFAHEVTAAREHLAKLL